MTQTYFSVNDYSFSPLIWSTFEYRQKKQEKRITEPFASFAKSAQDGSFYFVFRGSKSMRDFQVDLMTTPVSYDPPTTWPSAIQVHLFLPRASGLHSCQTF